jgi:HK97 family phage major capsid protein
MAQTGAVPFPFPARKKPTAMTTTAVSMFEELRRRRLLLRTDLQSRLEAAQAEGRTEMRANERAMCAELERLDDAIADRAETFERRSAAEASPILARIRGGGEPDTSLTPAPRRSGLGSAAALAPLNFGPDEFRRLQTAAQRGDPCRIESRAFSTADSLIPATLYPYPVAQVHEWRLLDKLPGTGFETPAITFIRHVSTTGSAGATAEGGLKNELVFNTDALTAEATKIAGHVGLSYEIINDFEAFQQYAGQELYKDIIDSENLQLLSGSGVAPNMTGFFNTSGILTHDCSTDTGTNVTVWDSLEIAINTLRVGPALAECDLMVFNPTDWSAIRRVKDAYGRFLVAPDPSDDQVNQCWGVDTLVTTQCPAKQGLLIDRTKFGYVGVRESLGMRIGYANDDLTRNILRFVGEERLVLCVTRPSAVLSITNLP